MEIKRRDKIRYDTCLEHYEKVVLADAKPETVLAYLAGYAVEPAILEQLKSPTKVFSP